MEEGFVKDRLTGWVDLADVQIPPIQRTGFAQDVMRRKRVLPIEEVEIKETTMKKAEIYTGDDPTTLIGRKARWEVSVRRVSTGQETKIIRSPFIIGKHMECDLVVRDNMTISRRHAQILTTPEGYLLEDLGSSNDTYVEGVKAEGKIKLTNGTRFRLSDEEFQFILEMG